MAGHWCTDDDGTMPGRELTEPSTPEGVLRRDPANARLGGVCAAISRSTGIDLRLVRISAVVLALSGGLGVALYLCGWLLLPSTTEPTIPLARVLPTASGWDLRTRTIITIVVAAVTWVALGSWLPFGFVPIVLALVLVLVHRSKVRSTPRDDADELSDSPGSQDFQNAVTAWQSRVEQVRSVPSDAEPRPAPDAAISRVEVPELSPALADLARRPMTAAPALAPPQSHPRRPSRQRGLGVVIGLIAASGAYMVGRQVYRLEQPMLPAPRLEMALAASLALIGAVLVVAALTRVRVRLLVPIGLVLCVWLGGVHAGVVDARGHWGPVVAGVGSASDPMRYSGANATLPLSSVDTGTTVRLVARMSQLDITVPADTTVVVRYRLRTADLLIGDERVSGSSEGQQTLTGTGATTITLELDALMSKVVVRHA